MTTARHKEGSLHGTLPHKPIGGDPGTGVTPQRDIGPQNPAGGNFGWLVWSPRQNPLRIKLKHKPAHAVPVVASGHPDQNPRAVATVRKAAGVFGPKYRATRAPHDWPRSFYAVVGRARAILVVRSVGQKDGSPQWGVFMNTPDGQLRCSWTNKQNQLEFSPTTDLGICGGGGITMV